MTKSLHRRVHACAQSGSAYLDPMARIQLIDLPYPRFYIDFETYAPAVPVRAGIRPYATQVPFQWSCHNEGEDGQLGHQAFLAEGPGDPRRPFLDSLLPVLGDVGTIFVYNAGFKRGRLRRHLRCNAFQIHWRKRGRVFRFKIFFWATHKHGI